MSSTTTNRMDCMWIFKALVSFFKGDEYSRQRMSSKYLLTADDSKKFTNITPSEETFSQQTN